MAEIKSTMDMVLERAARMAAESTHDNSDEDSIKTGMRLAAEHLRNTQEESLLAKLQEQKTEEQPAVLKGMGEALLRNIVLPREEMLMETGERALKAIVELVPGDISTVCTELTQILNQYNQHKEQMLQQLEDAIRTQLQQKMEQQETPVGEDISLNPTMHPQYQEEMTRMLTELNGQYNQALDERKSMILQQLTSSN